MSGCSRVKWASSVKHQRRACCKHACLWRLDPLLLLTGRLCLLALLKGQAESERPLLDQENKLLQMALSKIICKMNFFPSSPCRLRLGSAAVIQREGNAVKSNKPLCFLAISMTMP
ncbi:unnamed protein product [Pleuronectes platessa]|uniref:Uncharacterized protein n=1 Tax=Pleuronectes platessa TaxID=8262 RepID=A0A9N7VP79_PLEPL|nr:unnamed protein product [Pleuronectes platessa]